MYPKEGPDNIHINNSGEGLGFSGERASYSAVWRSAGRGVRYCIVGQGQGTQRPRTVERYKKSLRCVS
jgi:hypothetical protein